MAVIKQVDTMFFFYFLYIILEIHRPIYTMKKNRKNNPLRNDDAVMSS